MKILVTTIPKSIEDCSFGTANRVCKADDKGDTIYPLHCREFDSQGSRIGKCPHLMVVPIQNEKHVASLNDADLENRYALLDRLRSDCNYFLLLLAMGTKDESVLWAKSVSAQIAVMKVLWESLPEDGKPEWLTWEIILHFEREMAAAPGKAGDQHEV